MGPDDKNPFALARDAARGFAQKVQSGARSQAKKSAALAEGLIKSMAGAASDANEPRLLVRRFETALKAVEAQLDREAIAVSVGTLAEGGIGIAALTGTELFYVRGDGPVQAHLRISQLSGRSAQLALGAGTGGYVACFYGPRDVLARPLQRRGGDVSFVVGSLSVLRLTGGRVPAGGWMLGVGVGLGLGIPLVSQLSALELSERPLGGTKLSKSEAARIEAMIQGAPDRNLRRKAASAFL